MLNLTITEGDDFTKEAKCTGDIRDPAWMENLAKEGRILGLESGKAAVFGEQVAAMAKVLDGIYGENWDFTFDCAQSDGKDCFAPHIVLHYPELELSNDNGSTHTLRDLYAVLPMTMNEPYLEKKGAMAMHVQSVLATRATMTMDEFAHRYVHSHVSRTHDQDRLKELYLGALCLGKDSELEKQMMDLSKKFSPEAFELLVLTLDSALRWEALDSVPYVRMDSLNDGFPEEYHLSKSCAEDILRDVVQKLSTRNFTFTTSAERFCHRYAILQDRTFADEIHRAVMATGNESIIESVMSVHEDGKWMSYNLRRDSARKNIGPSPTGYWHRDRQVIFQVVAEEQEMEQVDYKVHPKFLNYAKDRIEQELHTYAAKALAAEREAIAGNRA